jgi:hypothetical protein
MSNAARALNASPRKQACGDCPYKPQQRSQAAHNHLFAVISEAFKQWPESAEFQPEDAEHLRSYLLVKAKHYDKLDVRCKNSDAISLRMQLDAVIRAFCDGKPPLMHVYPWGIRIFKPRSISYAAADRKIFNAVSETVFQIIEDAIGVKIEDLKSVARQEAA